MAGKSASLFPLVITSSFMSITGVEQLWARTVGIANFTLCIATKMSKKTRARTRVELAQERDNIFFITFITKTSGGHRAAGLEKVACKRIHELFRLVVLPTI